MDHFDGTCPTCHSSCQCVRCKEGEVMDLNFDKFMEGFNMVTKKDTLVLYKWVAILNEILVRKGLLTEEENQEIQITIGKAFLLSVEK